MITTSVATAVAVGVGANQVLAGLPPVHGLCQLRVSIDVTAVVGAPSIVFDLFNLDGDQVLGTAGATIGTKVTDNAGQPVATAAVTAAGVVEIFTKYPANCRDAVVLVATNNVAATSATVTVVATVTEAAP